MAGLRANLAGILTFRDYLAQHWQGGFTLGYAVWVNGVVLGFLADLVMTLPAEGVEALSLGGYRLPALALYLAGLTLDLAILAWQIVGIARSAARHEERGGRRVWAFLTRCALVVAVIGLPFVFMAEYETLRGLLSEWS